MAEEKKEADAFDALVLAEADFNGNCYVEGAEGERYVPTGGYMVVVPENLAVPHWLSDNDVKSDFETLNINAATRKNIIARNFRIVRPHCDSDREAYVCAYYRYLAVWNGLVSAGYDHDAYHCSYSEVITYVPADAVDQPTKAALYAAVHGPHVPNAGELEKLREVFFDYVGLLAYMFRARGHHYLDEGKYDETLNRIWTSCLYDLDQVPLRWKIGFTYGLHAIYPVVLDTFWRKAAAHSFIAGALVKRLDVAAAGSAIMSSLFRGISDIRVTIPKLPADLESQWDNFLAIHALWKANRWGYSVNARLYGKERIRIPEEDFSVLASYVAAIYNSVQEDAPLTQSMSLQRNARANPVTGYIMWRATSQMINKYSMALAYGDKIKDLRVLLEGKVDAPQVEE